jgi:hypothetical protein
MSKQSEGMTPLRLRRVHGDPKRKTPPVRARSQISSSWNVGPEGRSEDETSIFKKVAMPTVGRSSRGVVEAGFQ